MENVLLVDRSALEQAEPYGDCLTHAAGHYERWEAWQALGRAGRARAGFPELIASTEYDGWPRGRIVYEVPVRRFVMYADRRLQLPSIVTVLRTAFGLVEADVVVRSDSHYR